MKPFSGFFQNLFFTSLLISLLLTGCDSDSSEVSDSYASDPVVSFTIRVSTTRTSSRAGNNEDDNAGDPNWGNNPKPESGVSFESKVENIMAVLYEVDDSDRLITSDPVGHLVNPIYEYNSDGSLTISGRLQTKLTPGQLEDATNRFRMAIFVNSPDIDISNPSASCFSLCGASGTSDFTSIPMYGVGAANFSGLTRAIASKETPFPIKDQRGDASTLVIPILRSMAQVRVKVDKNLFSSRKMRLQSISISRHADKGFFVPYRWDELESLLSLGIEESMNGWNDSFSTGKQILPTVKDDDYELNSQSMLRFYIPETYNTAAGDPDELKLTVNYTADDTEEETPLSNTILFRQYDKNGHPTDSKPWNLVRNHIYEFIITGINQKTGELEITVDASWWGEHQLDII
ncbi:MAG: hypothetical protein K2N05_09525 [Muribaculaceae bacterium]|nr:hypothetical protein [Muribaculaceae bacterium]